MTTPNTDPFRLVVVSGGTSDPSTTRMLADRIAGSLTARADEHDHQVATSVVDLRELATEISHAMTAQLYGPKLTRAVAALREADGIVASAPVYKAGPSGLFTSFFHVLDNDLLIATPVVLAATAGTPRHALVIDDQMRPMFAYLRTLTAPTSVYASTEDWNDTELTTRIDRAAAELFALMESGVAHTIRGTSWRHYQHEFGSAGGSEVSIDLDSDLMKLAAGGSIATNGSTVEGGLGGSAGT